MKVYVVTSGCYSDYHIDRVFTDRHKAEMYCAVCNREYKELDDWDESKVEEFETSDDDIEGKLDLHYMFEVYDGQKKPKEYGCIYRLSPKNKNQIHIDRYSIEAIVFLTRNDPELALEIGTDMIAQKKAELNGL